MSGDPRNRHTRKPHRLFNRFIVEEALPTALRYTQHYDRFTVLCRSCLPMRTKTRPEAPRHGKETDECQSS